MLAVRTNAGLSESAQKTGNSDIGDQQDSAIHEPDCYPELLVYPLEEPTRAAFRTTDGKKLTAHQWAVYDFTRTIPWGRVTTYAAVCKAIGKGSPRSIGAALRHNPFAPVVPCHRVIASNCYVGGFFGEWGTLRTEKKGDISGKQCQRKMDILAMEGVSFTAKGFLADKSLLWVG